MKALLAVSAALMLYAVGTLPASAQITPANVAALEVKWDFALAAGVTSSPVVANGLLYASAWDGFVYALNPDDGSIVWSFDTGTGAGGIGVQSTILVTPGGDVCFGDSLARVWCRDGDDGSPLWDKPVGNPVVDHIWSGLTTANGCLFVSLASHSDVPCTQGRLVALDLANGNDLWSLQTVPEMICDTDTAVECADDSECPASGTCIEALGAGVTATVSSDPTGNFVYMNTVGCYTFPSVGDSDSIFKINAATGAVVWKTRVNDPEQFGACSNDSSIDCGVDADCGAGTCESKFFYHDFGFLNGPIPIDVPDGPGTKTLIVSGSKNGTLYALDESTGMIEWSNAVQPTPVSPGFAGFGLFNGPLGVANGIIYAALNELIPARVCDNDLSKGCGSDANCDGGTCLPLPDHLMAFDATNGSVVWSDEIGTSWSGIGVANGVVYAGTNDTAEFFAYDAASGARLATFPLPTSTSSVATVDGDTLYIGYGIFGPSGGVRAYAAPLTPVPTLPGWGAVVLATLLLLTFVAARWHAAHIRQRTSGTEH